MTPTVEFLTEGDEFYAHAIRAIEKAKRSVRLMVYIWQDDEIGHAFEKALAKRAQQGLFVQVVIDAIGSFELPASVLDRLSAARVEVFMHHRLRLLRQGWFRYLIRRNHRKILLIDDQLAYTGGFNLMRQCSRRYYGAARWLDIMVAVREPRIVRHIAEQYQDAGRRARHSKWASRLLLRSRNQVIVADGSRVVSFAMSRWLKRRLRKAQRKIVIAVPYFVPYGFFWRVLMKKLRQNVQVEIILSERSDLPWIDAVSFHLARRLMMNGAQVYLYRGEGKLARFSHSKYFEIDDWCGTGSANYDYRSMVLNLDTLLFFRGNRKLAHVIKAMRQGAYRVGKEMPNGGIRARLLMPFRWLL